MSNCLLDNAIYLDDVDKSQFKNYIGNGYRNVFYTTDENRNGRIILFGFDKGGNANTFILPWSSHVKYVVKFPTQEQDIYDRYVNVKYFKNTFERKKWVDNFEADKIVECLRPEQEVLHFLFDNDVLTEGFNTQPLRIHYFDIETEISDQFERPRDARNRINMMTIYDSKTEKFYTWSLQHAEIDFKEDPLKDYPKDKFVFFEFNDDEEALLEHFLDWQQNNYADVNFGWNTRAYDLPYLVRRIENVLGKGAAQRLSPVNRYFIKEVKELNQSPGTEPDIEVSVEGLFIADGLVLYRDKFGLGRPDGGFALDNIGEAEGCGHKIKYEGTLKDLYLKDYQRFYEYNVRDVDLVMRIEKKTKMINLSRTIPSFGLCPYSTVYSSISYLVGSIISFAKTQMNKVMCSYVGEKKHFDGFEGAFVFPSQVGVFRHGIAGIDFASLYPSLLRSLNASPETYRGKVLIHKKGPDGCPLPVNEKNELHFDIFDDKVAKADDIIGYSIKYPNGKRAKVDLDKLRDWIVKHGIYTANNTIFLKHEEKWGVIAKWCEYFYNQRKATKKKMFTFTHELHNNAAAHSKEELAKMEEQAENLNARQGAFKNMINSVYGQLGSSFSPIANIDIAQSVTRSGRFCNINASRFVLKRFQELYDPNFKGYKISILDENHPEYKTFPKIDVIALGGDTDTVISTTKLRIKIKQLVDQIEIGILYQQLVNEGAKIIHNGTYELLPCENIDILTYGNKYVPIVALSRHKTPKHLLQICVKDPNDNENKVTVTTDHVCMIYTRDHFFDNTNAQNLQIGQLVSVYDEKTDIELVGTITDIIDLGNTTEYVYDLEVDDDLHSFYANDILIHNSQFIDLQPLTKVFSAKNSLPEKISAWPQEKRQELWDIMEKMTDTEINQFVRNLVAEKFKTTQSSVLTYELEYMGDVMVMEGKKHYMNHLIFKDGDASDYLKTVGIALKKNETDKAMKDCLSECYKGVIYNDWTEKDYNNYISELYEKFSKLDIDQVAFWKGYGTAREAIGFLTMATGTTGIAKAATYYNQIIEKLGLSKIYDQIQCGDKCRFVYLKTTNPYGINCIAYKPGQWPKEFDKIFQVDYSLMFDKVITDQLKRYREACGFHHQDPRKQVVQDVFEL